MATKKAPEEVAILNDEGGGDSPQIPETPPTPSTEVKIPELADKILELYPEYEKLYVDDKCGVFVNGSKLPINYTKAVLYTNPYYQSKS